MSECTTGACCQGFTVSATREEVMAMKADPLHFMDGLIIAYMLIPREDGNYDCTHFNPTTGRCTIYERRPAMCREYPYRGGSCKREGCTL